MKVLLDENLDHGLRTLLGQHDVVTVTYMGWTGLKAISYQMLHSNIMTVLRLIG